MRNSIITAAILFAGASIASAQTPMRYTGMPAKVTFSTADTVINTMQAPSGPMTTSVGATSIFELELHPVGDSTHVVSKMKEMNANMDMMGQTMAVPVPPGATDPVEFMLARNGRTRHVKGAGAPSVTSGAMPTDEVSRMFLLLPAKAIRIGDTWADTINETVDSAGIKLNLTGINRGVYAADTTVDGKKHMVLRFAGETTMKMEGTVQGMAMSQDMKGKTTTLALFDPARNLITFMRDENTLTGTMDAPSAGMTAMGLSMSIRRTLRLMP